MKQIPCFRFLSFYGGLVGSIIYYLGFGLILMLFRSTEEVMQWAIPKWGKFNLKSAGIDFEISGRENLEKRPAIFVINHQSMLDLFIMCYLRPPKTLGVAKKSLIYIPVIGLFMKAVGVVFLDRHDRMKALEGMRATKRLIDQGYSIVMAPEGTRTLTGELQPLKKGAFYLALQTGLPIIPITIVNAYQLFPRQSWIPKPGIVKVYIDPPIATKELTEATIPAMIERVHSVFLSHLVSPPLQ